MILLAEGLLWSRTREMAQDDSTTNMTAASTRRLQQTSSGYLLLLLLTLLSQPSPWAGRNVMGFTLLGLLCTAAACLGRIWCSVFIAGRKDQQLVTQGPYALCRHPLYALSLLGGAGIALATASLSLGLALLIGLWGLLQAAAVAEERHLAAQFAEDYPIYRAQTPRFWPSAWRLSGQSPAAERAAPALPQALTVHPPILWKAFVDAGAFFLLFTSVVLARQVSLHHPLMSSLALW